MKVLEAAIKANQRPQLRQLGVDRNKGGIPNTPLHASARPNGPEAWTMREIQR